MKKITCIILAVLFILALLTACSEQGSGDTTTLPPSADASTAPPEETELVSNTLTESLDFAEAEVRFLSRDSNNVRDEIHAENINGEVVNDEVYSRNQQVEKYLNVKFVSRLISGDNYAIPNEMRTAISSGSKDIEIIANSTYSTIMYANENLFHNLLECTYIDFEAPYWSQGFNECASIGKGQYMVTGSAAITLYRYMFVTFVNQELLEAKNVESLYDVVNSGRWTLDYQIRLAEDMFDDKNGNSKADAGDVFGFISHTVSYIDPYLSSCRNHIISKNADNFLEYTLDVDRMATTLDKVIALYNGAGSFITTSGSDDGVQSELVDIFAQDQSATATLRLCSVESEPMRQMKSEYGILPMPKLDENQEDYYTFLHDQFTSFAICSTVATDEQLQMLGAVLECLAWRSYLTVAPAYYNVALKGKYLQNSESWEMLDRIYDGVYIDAGVLYTKSLLSIHQQPRSIVASGTNTASSYFKAIKTALNKQIDKLNDGIAEIQG